LESVADAEGKERMGLAADKRFFLKKEPKTFHSPISGPGEKLMEVFCFFFSKKKHLLSQVGRCADEVSWAS
jgi:hypothetical protein